MKPIEWIMIAAFIGGLALSLYKVYLFLPQKPLADDDMTPESIELLERIMGESYFEGISHTELYEAMQAHRDFDPKHFWRFNLNRLRHLIEHYRFKDPSFRL